MVGQIYYFMIQLKFQVSIGPIVYKLRYVYFIKVNKLDLCRRFLLQITAMIADFLSGKVIVENIYIRRHIYVRTHNICIS